MMRLNLHLPILALGLTMLSACASAGEPKLAVCDGKHRRPANPYGSVLAVSPAAAAPKNGPSLAPAAPISPVGPHAMIDARSLRPCGADA